jgi:DNA-directed RNA polymerase subunit RPC12/RpoP
VITLLQLKKYTITSIILFLISSTVISVFHRPVEPGSMAGYYSQVNTCNVEELKSVAIRVSSVSFLADRSQCIKKEQSTLKGIRNIKMKKSDSSLVPKCQITSQLSVQGSSMMAQPDTNKLTAKCQEPVGHTETASITVCSNLNEIVGLQEDRVQSVTSTCEYLSLGSMDFIHHEGDHSDSLAMGENNKRNVNDKLINDESYLNCDVESLCLEPAFRETNEKIYPCRYCGEMFLVKSNLVLHQTTYHSDHPVGCELCGKVLYKSRSEFMEHVCEHHSDNTYS